MLHRKNIHKAICRLYLNNECERDQETCWFNHPEKQEAHQCCSCSKCGNSQEEDTNHPCRTCTKCGKFGAGFSESSSPEITRHKSNYGANYEEYEVRNDQNVPNNDCTSAKVINPIKITTRNTKNLHTLRRSNNIIQALELPTCLNINPRSLYNCIEEFQTYVQEKNIDVAFVSETWEREKLPLPELIKLPNHTVISNVYQRKGVGGIPALVINHNKYTITTPVESYVTLPWGVEATPAMIVPNFFYK